MGEGKPAEDFLREEWRSMQRRIVAHLEHGKRMDFAEATRQVDASSYTDPQRFEVEQRAIFRSQPLLAGFSGEVAQKGDQLLFDAAGVSALILRAGDGTLRAYLNLCPHRGARLVERCARVPRITCPFHGWSFDLEGKLAGAPLPEAFDPEDLAERRLFRLPVAEWKGMIFVRLEAGGAEIDVEGFLGPIAPVLAALDFEGLAPVKSERVDLPANWKLALDTFAETYHVPALHRDSLATTLYPYVEINDHYGLHHRYCGPGLDFAPCVGKPESEWPEIPYQAVHLLFPNTVITFTHALDGATPVTLLFRVLPGASVGESITIASTYRRAATGGASEEEIAALHDAVLDVVRNEDYRTLRESWQGILHAPPGFRFLLGRGEEILQCFHRDFDAAIAREAASAPEA